MKARPLEAAPPTVVAAPTRRRAANQPPALTTSPAPPPPKSEARAPRPKELGQKTPPVKAPRMKEPRPKAPRTKERRFHVALPKFRLPKIEIRKGEDQVVDLEADQEFVYKACNHCNRTDWLVRTTRNDDATWNYWCVWCSRSMKTPMRLPHGRNPLVAAGVVVFVLVAASLLLR